MSGTREGVAALLHKPAETVAWNWARLQNVLVIGCGRKREHTFQGREVAFNVES